MICPVCNGRNVHPHSPAVETWVCLGCCAGLRERKGTLVFEGSVIPQWRVQLAREAVALGLGAMASRPEVEAARERRDSAPDDADGVQLGLFGGEA